MKVKEESEKFVGLKLNIQKIKIMASGPITSWQIDGETVETVADFIFLGSKITAESDCSHKGGVICISKVIDISPGNLDSSLGFFQSSVSDDVRRNINNLRYADDTTLTAESEEELKSLLMKVNRVKKLA